MSKRNQSLFTFSTLAIPGIVFLLNQGLIVSLVVYVAWTLVCMVQAYRTINGREDAKTESWTPTEVSWKHTLLFFLVHKVHYELNFLKGVIYCLKINLLPWTRRPATE
jgi:hypothetical protein